MRQLVRRIEEVGTTRGGIIIPDSAKDKPQEGEVISVGKGKTNDEGKLFPLAVKEGDRILFGKYSGTEIKIDGEDFLIMKEEEVLHFRVQLRRKDRIAIVDEELIGMIARNGVPQLLERPFRRRMSRHIAMQNAAASDLHGTNTNRIRKRAVTATRKSQATIP